MSRIGEVVRGNVSSLFGRFRPPAGRTEEEIRSAKAERIEFGDRLIPMLKLLGDGGGTTEKAVRGVFRELQSEPTSMPMPTPDSIAARVREKLNIAEERPDCPGCVRLGGIPGIFSDLPAGQGVRKGDTQVERHWLCHGHLEPVVWFLSRQSRYEDGISFPYPPPLCLIPKDSYVPGAGPDHYHEHIDGALICELGLWAREFVEGLLGDAILDEPVLHV